MERKEKRMRIFRLVLLVIGFLLIADTLIVSTLSNFNLGVVLPAFFGIPMVLIAILLPQMKTGILCILKWAAVAGYAIAGIIFLVCGILMASAAKPASQVFRKGSMLLPCSQKSAQ